MSVEEMTGLGVALLVMFIGLIGCVVPGLPGTPLVLVGAIGHRLYFGQASVSNAVLVILVLLTLVSLVLDYLASVFGARKMGASWRGVAGAVIGAIVGLFFGPAGILLGPFLGALLFELLGGREFTEATRAGAGALIGLIVGAVGKLACSAAMIGLFALNVYTRSGISGEGGNPAIPAALAAPPLALRPTRAKPDSSMRAAVKVVFGG
jgi:uncharacterized protein YqgC (DUF456 family)